MALLGGPKRAIMGHFGPFWASPGQIGPFTGACCGDTGPCWQGPKGPKWPKKGHFGPFWAILAHFRPILGLFRGPPGQGRSGGQKGSFWAKMALLATLAI